MAGERRRRKGRGESKGRDGRGEVGVKRMKESYGMGERGDQRRMEEWEGREVESQGNEGKKRRRSGGQERRIKMRKERHGKQRGGVGMN